MSLRSARCILLTPSLHLRSYDDSVNRDGVRGDNDCGLVVDDFCEGSDTNERDEKSVDDECCDSELEFVGVKCVDNASSCLAEQSDVDGANGDVDCMTSDTVWLQVTRPLL